MSNEEMEQWRQVFDAMSSPMQCTYYVDGKTYQMTNKLMGWESFMLAMIQMRTTDQQSVIRGPGET